MKLSNSTSQFLTVFFLVFTVSIPILYFLLTPQEPEIKELEGIPINGIQKVVYVQKSTIDMEFATVNIKSGPVYQVEYWYGTRFYSVPNQEDPYEESYFMDESSDKYELPMEDFYVLFNSDINKRSYGVTKDLLAVLGPSMQY